MKYLLSLCALGLLALPAFPGEANAQWNTDKTGRQPLAGGGGLPSGMVVFIDGTISACPSGWTELSFSGDYILLTTSLAGGVGTTGGSNSYTPAGTVSQPTLTPSGTNSTANFTPSGTIAWPVNPEIFTGSALGTHSHTLTPAGTNSTSSFTPAGTNSAAPFTPAGTVGWPANPPIFNGSTTSVPAQTFTGTPATLTGSVSQPTLTGTPATIQPTYLKLIPCRKN